MMFTVKVVFINFDQPNQKFCFDSAVYQKMPVTTRIHFSIITSGYIDLFYIEV